MLGALICSVSKHKIDRHRVWNDGLHFRTKCIRCGRPLLRDLDGWRTFEPERDDNPLRSPHPPARPSN